MIVEYNTTTKEITAAHYGRPYIASEWASYDVTGQAIANCPDEETIMGKYLIIAEDGTGSFSNINSMTVSVTKSIISANGVDYCDFSGIVEGSTIYLDGASAGTADAEGTVRFSATDAGTYVFRFYKYTYATESISIIATDEYLYDNITG